MFSISWEMHGPTFCQNSEGHKVADVAVAALRAEQKDVYRTFDFISRAAQMAASQAVPPVISVRREFEKLPQLVLLSHDLEEVEGGGVRCT